MYIYLYLYAIGDNYSVMRDMPTSFVALLYH